MTMGVEMQDHNENNENTVKVAEPACDTAAKESSAMGKDTSVKEVEAQILAEGTSTSTSNIEIVEEGGDEKPKVRKIRRRARRTRPRSKTIAMKRLTREELRLGALLNPPVDIPRPQTRAECQGEARPCPWVACKHHLYLDVNPETGSIKINFPDLEPWELKHTCALDVADRNGITLEDVGEIMNLTRERIRQVEVRGLAKLRAMSPSREEIGAGSLEDFQ
jgi:DNA-directed RNA polymerase sigma subunit (sigma70/sigma32)